MSLTMRNAWMSEEEKECLEKILKASKTSQALFLDIFSGRVGIRDRGLYWAVSRIQYTLVQIISLTEKLLKQDIIPFHE